MKWSYSQPHVQGNLFGFLLWVCHTICEIQNIQCTLFTNPEQKMNRLEGQNRTGTRQIVVDREPTDLCWSSISLSLSLYLRPAYRRVLHRWRQKCGRMLVWPLQQSSERNPDNISSGSRSWKLRPLLMQPLTRRLTDRSAADGGWLALFVSLEVEG